MTEVRSKSSWKGPKGGEKEEVEIRTGKLRVVAKLKKGEMGMEGEGSTVTLWQKPVASLTNLDDG